MVILENSPESVKKAKQLLGIPVDRLVGFQKVLGKWEPYLEYGGRIYQVGDEILEQAPQATQGVEL